MSEDDKPEDLSGYSMLELFRMEVTKQLAEFSRYLLVMEHAPEPGHWEALLRALHSIKGAARMLDAGAVVRIVHALEEFLLAAQQGGLVLDARAIDLLLAQGDMIQHIVGHDEAQILAWEQNHEAELAQLQHQLESLLQPGDTATEVAEDEIPAERLPASGAEAPADELRIHASRLDRILGLASGVLVESHRFRAHLDRLSQVKQLHFALVAELDRLRQCASTARLDEAARGHLQRLERLAADCRQQFADLLAELEAFDRRSISLNEQLHQEVLSSRMRPFADLVADLPRLVRDLGRQLGKEVRLEMRGTETLVDRDVLERIDVSLKHLIQNAIDHGIEAPDVRRAMGKPACGTLRLEVSQSAGMLFVLVADDGAGVDLAALGDRLVQQGLCSPEELVRLDEMALLDYLFVPGFSSRDQATHYSGRGIGLDVVRETIESLQGSIHAATDPGQGTRFQILLPLTVSVLRALQVQIDGEPYAFPLTGIHRLLRIPARILCRPDGSSVDSIEVDGEPARLCHASSAFGRPLPRHFDDELVVLVIGRRPPYTALVVEKVLGEQELALSSLEPLLGELAGISAAALLEDGSVTLVVDCDQLESLIAEGFERGEIPAFMPCRQHTSSRPRVLVADESMTARVLQKNLLEAQGYEVILVADGAHARQALEEQGFDLLVCDGNLPGLPGQELLAWLREREATAHLPVILLRDSGFDGTEENMPTVDDAVWQMEKTDFDAQGFIATVAAALQRGRRYDERRDRSQ